MSSIAQIFFSETTIIEPGDVFIAWDLADMEDCGLGRHWLCQYVERKETQHGPDIVFHIVDEDLNIVNYRQRIGEEFLLPLVDGLMTLEDYRAMRAEQLEVA